MMIRYKDYLSLMKLRIDVFITLSGLAAALAMARGPLSVSHTAWLATALMLASASAALFNQYADRDLDGLMERTRHRALPAGRVRPPGGFVLGAIPRGAGVGGAPRAVNGIG